MNDTLEVINGLESAGVIGKYAIGGAIGLLFYTEPATTYGLDVFCSLPKKGRLIDFAPLYNHLGKLGYSVKNEHVNIEGIPVQFLPPASDLVKEALEQSVKAQFAGVLTRVFQYEHLLAIMSETGRPKDKARIALALGSADPDADKLKEILKRHELLDKWAKITT
jgi:hypothetical protein